MSQFNKELSAVGDGDSYIDKTPRLETVLGLFERLRLERIGRLAAYAGVIGTAVLAAGVAAKSASSHPDALGAAKISHPLDYVGVTSNRIWVPDRQEAVEAAQEIADTGANTVRIFEPLSPGQAEIDNDKVRLCNAAEAARESNLTLEISYMGHQGSKVNYVPSSAAAVTRFITTDSAVLWNIAGPNANKRGPNGSPPCVEEPLSKVIVEVFNEVNSGTFNANRDAPKKYAYLMSRAGPALAKDADNINQALEAATPAGQQTAQPPFTLIRAAGGLAVGNSDPIGFLRDFDIALKNLGVTTVPFDLLTIHPYPRDITSDPAGIEAALYGPMKSELDTSWGNSKVSIFYDEIGVRAVAAAKRSLYGPKSLSVSSVTIGTQAQYYHNTFKEASEEEGVVGVLTFQGEDASDDGWPSGIVNPDSSHKPSWNSVAQTFHDALAGTLGD